MIPMWIAKIQTSRYLLNMPAIPLGPGISDDDAVGRAVSMTKTRQPHPDYHAAQFLVY